MIKVLFVVACLWVYGGVTHLHAQTRPSPIQLQSQGLLPGAAFESLDNDNFAADSPFRIDASIVGLLLLKQSDALEPQCNGFLISPKYVLTARHCIADQVEILGNKKWIVKEIKQLELVLDFLKYGGETYTVPLKTSPVEVGKEDLDYAVLEINGTISTKGRHFPTIGSVPRPKQDLYIVQCPGNETLKLTRMGCHAADDPEQGDLLRHLCETVPGSSGAPVFNYDHQIVGVHTGSGKNSQGGANIGVLLSKIFDSSHLISASFGSSETGAEISAKKPPEQILVTSYRMADGRLFARDSGGWTERVPGQTARRLILQQSADNEYTLWDATTDVLYLIPKNGGTVKQRRGVEQSWEVIGRATKVN